MVNLTIHEHVAILNEWLADKKKGIVRPCPFLRKDRMKAMTTRKKKKKALTNVGLLKVRQRGS